MVGVLTVASGGAKVSKILFRSEGKIDHVTDISWPGLLYCGCWGGSVVVKRYLNPVHQSMDVSPPPRVTGDVLGNEE